MARKQTICVDFDGVLHAYRTPWRGAHIIPDEPVAGALEWLESAVDDFAVCIYSARSRQPGGIDAMKRWLAKWAISHFDHDQVALKRFMAKLRFPTEKPPAILYIDDRAWCFRGQFPTKQQIQTFRPWNR